MSAEPNLSRFAIYRGTPPGEKHRQESLAIYHLLCRLDKTTPFDNVVFGTDPPDFIFKIRGQDIGAELTDIDPTIFAKGGNRARGQFKKWEADIPNDGFENIFSWAKRTLGETMAAFEHRVKTKQQDAAAWKIQCPEKWLLMRVADGSSFSELLGGEHEATPGMEEEVANYFAKAIYELNAICKRAQPFDRVLIFIPLAANMEAVTCSLFPPAQRITTTYRSHRRKHWKRGASASADFLTWKHGGETVKRVTNIPLGKLHEHFGAKPHTKL
jgi:hypothetical protein